MRIAKPRQQARVKLISPDLVDAPVRSLLNKQEEVALWEKMGMVVVAAAQGLSQFW